MNALQLDTVRMSADRTHLEILDQTLLPGTVKVLQVSKIEDIWEAIKLLRVRGAPAIGVAGAAAVMLAAWTLAGECESPALFAARPTRRSSVKSSWNRRNTWLLPVLQR